jgi:SAM-dependent methyltransferase
MTRGSVSFGRAAAYYDETRGLSREGMRQTIELLDRECAGRGRILEIGVGTGQIAVPLYAEGIDVVGVDLARPMLDRLVEKSGEGRRVPLVEGDATRLPFANAAFGAAYLRWVLHLVPAWPAAMEELARVVRPRGVIVASLGTLGDGPRREIYERFVQVAAMSKAPVGLGWGDWDTLDQAMTQLGARARPLSPYLDTDRNGPGAYMDALEQNLHSWTWSMPEDLRLRAAAEVRAWAEARFGPLDQLPPHRYEVAWRAYDLP